MGPENLREVRCILRYHNHAVRNAVKAKNKISGVLMEVGEPERFSSLHKAVSYCGLCSAQRESAGKTTHGAISKK